MVLRDLDGNKVCGDDIVVIVVKFSHLSEDGERAVFDRERPYEVNKSVPYLYSPKTWYAGNYAAILTYFDEWKKPVVVGGDSPGSDTYMLFHGVDVAKGYVHLWINRSEPKYQELQTMIGEAAKGQEKNGLKVTVDKNWVVVRPEEIL
ncbi:hypothetical protein PG999_002888 [Apiospora kogelbergensis]|uniref:Uncharacterized protein n=1 Tax=Apiospora kogelbergensis TaxID=1337665 RepID=A0AAW0R9N2_9PEZI